MKNPELIPGPLGGGRNTFTPFQGTMYELFYTPGAI